MSSKPGAISHSLWRCLLAVVMLAGASNIRAGVGVQYQCAGSLELANQSPPIVIEKVLALRSTAGFQNIALAKFSRALTNSLRLGKDATSASLIAPLFGDLVQRESLGSFSNTAGKDPSFILAVHLGAQQAQLWQDNASKIFGGEGKKFAIGEFGGRRWKGGGSNDFWMIPAKDWLLVGCGDEFSSLENEYLSRLKAQGRPVAPLGQNWLEAEIDSRALGGWFRYLKPAQIKFTVKPVAENLQLRLVVHEAHDTLWKAEAWQVPKDLIQGQVISFTAGRNLAAFLNVNPSLAHLSGNPLTNQFYFWALDQVPLLNFMAWPQPEASNVLERLSTEVPSALNRDLKRFNGTELVWQPDAHKLSCRNVRLFAPTLEAVQSSEGQFLFLSSFPRPPGGRAPPEALLSQLQGRSNLVYYDWEATGRRLTEWQILDGMVANRSLAPGNDAVDKAATESEWLSAVAPLAGNTVTEITCIAPNELSCVRTAPLGFTGVELILLADWLCDANIGPIHAPLPSGKSGSAPVRPPPAAH